MKRARSLMMRGVAFGALALLAGCATLFGFDEVEVDHALPPGARDSAGDSLVSDVPRDGSPSSESDADGGKRFCELQDGSVFCDDFDDPERGSVEATGWQRTFSDIEIVPKLSDAEPFSGTRSAILDRGDGGRMAEHVPVMFPEGASEIELRAEVRITKSLEEDLQTQNSGLLGVGLAPAGCIIRYSLSGKLEGYCPDWQPIAICPTVPPHAWRRVTMLIRKDVSGLRVELTVEGTPLCAGSVSIDSKKLAGTLWAHMASDNDHNSVISDVDDFVVYAR